ncbi:universal stress protein [Microbacterium sp. W4I20]|uniref:universal stress protein n=1 Tax=Microbacterium sp. W4I20 TaxID=3042262 RepID=UPI002789270D|nr:universal stress protein [Microbacterium sp. W4I20]MDQ0729201.1 nucleotide-binding universal stress UspA family protein [Microbacterium sp. W4I20]
MKTIVVGFDGSNASFVAVEWAAERAAHGESRVEIVTIGGTILSDESRIGESLRAAELRLRDSAPGCDVTSRRVEGTMPAALLEQAAAAHLLVVGAHRNGAANSIMSGRFLRLATRSLVPIVVVPDHWLPSDAAVVVGLSGHEASSQAVELAASEANSTGASLAIVHAWEMPVPRVEGPVSLRASPIQVRSEHARTVRRATLSVRAAYPALAVEQVLAHRGAAEVLHERARDASLLVIGSTHRGILADPLFGSITHELLTRSAIPVCIVPHAALPA